MVDNEPVAAVVYDPYARELFSAGKGQGAWLNGQRLHIEGGTLSQSLVLIGSAPYNMELTERTFAAIRKVFGRCQDIRRSGSAALDLCYVAAGTAPVIEESGLTDLEV